MSRSTVLLLAVLPLSLGVSSGLSSSWRERMRAQRHIRPHVNPLQRRFTDATLPASFGRDAFASVQPLHLDIGCGKGHFCADLAAARPDLNVLGIEIRDPLVEEAERLASEVRNLRFLAGSANACAAAAIDAVLAQGDGDHAWLHSVTVQFPDPWPKVRHHKRRVVQPPLVHELAERLRPGGFVFLQSDVEEVALDMRASFLGCSRFVEVAPSHADEAARAETGADAATTFWLNEQQRPFPIQTERERQADRRGLDVFRTLLTLE